MRDNANGYETNARQFLIQRARTEIGASNVRAWSGSLPRGGSVLDLGCGDGLPISKALIEGGFEVHGVDASPSMVAAFRARHPGVPVVCERVERSAFFSRSFDGAVAWGLLFLLPGEVQALVIGLVAAALEPGGRFLFTAPVEVGSWDDALTGRRSVSLGFEAYVAAIADAGLTLEGEDVDEGANHYYLSRRGAGQSLGT